MVSLGVALLALCGNAAAFSILPPSTHIWAARPQRTALAKSRFFPIKNKSDVSSFRGDSNANDEQVEGTVSRGSAVWALKAAELGSDGGSSSRPAVDVNAIAKYIIGTGVEFGSIMAVLSLLQGNVLPRLAAKQAKSAVFLIFGFLAMKSRTFAVLSARRPEVSQEAEAKEERRRPDWMPPPKVFPFIWITIGILRAVSSTLVWEAMGGQMLTVPIAAMVFHLSMGDTWNHINNVEKRLGVAVPVVFLVWLSVVNAGFRYYRALPKAGLLVLPSIIWIGVANLLVQSIWRLNGKEPLYPTKQKS